MRRFVCLPVPAEVRRALVAAIAPLRESEDERLSWTRPEGWHVTLAFLGEVEDARVPQVIDLVRSAVDEVALLPRRLRLAAAGRFGRHTLWVGVEDEPAGAVATLGAALQARLADAGLHADPKPLRPHLTIARSRRAGAAVTAAVVDAVSVPPDTGWLVGEVELWRSRLGDGPARYEVDAVVALP